MMHNMFDFIYGWTLMYLDTKDFRHDQVLIKNFLYKNVKNDLDEYLSKSTKYTKKAS